MLARMRGPRSTLAAVRRRLAPATPAATPGPAVPPVAEQVVRYLALRAVAERHGEAAARDLTAAELKVFSQNGEDGVLAEMLARIGTGSGTFAEIGAGDGTESTCQFLADVLGWGGVLAEGDPAQAARLARKYERRPQVRVVTRWIGPGDADALVRAAGPGDPDVLAIDVDGIDWWIWHGLSDARPRIVVVEYNAALGDRPVTVPRDHAAPWDHTAYFGSSLRALELLAAAKGYRLVHTDLTGTNAFFVRADLDRDLPPPEAVPRRAANYLLRGIAFPPAAPGREWTDVTTVLP